LIAAAIAIALAERVLEEFDGEKESSVSIAAPIAIPLITRVSPFNTPVVVFDAGVAAAAASRTFVTV
jgi:hypothetical protein